jgi:predicted nucleic acid-binding protein
MDFVDSNIWLYAFVRGSDASKRRIAVSVISAGPHVVSSQVVNEVCVNLMRKASFDEVKLERIIRAFHRRCVVVPVDEPSMLAACRLRSRYSLSFWDSLIVAAALASGYTRLISEDMNDGLVVENSLTIVNPFRGP